MSDERTDRDPVERQGPGGTADELSDEELARQGESQIEETAFGNDDGTDLAGRDRGAPEGMHEPFPGTQRGESSPDLDDETE